MGKTKKQKKKREDFKKVKLKVGKKRPEAANVTTTAFKAASIQLPKQLEETEGPSNKKNQTLKDLLIQVSHYNSNIRQDAFHGLKELISQNPQVLHLNVSAIIMKIIDKIVDGDAAVRHHFIYCLQHIFRNLSTAEMTPFFPIIVAHLSCAMTHIDEDIQIDSLRLLDLCLEHFPSLFVERSQKVLRDFAELISRKHEIVSPLKGSSLSKGGQHKNLGISSIVNRQLINNPKGKLSSAKVRQKILERLDKMLDILVSNNTTDKDVKSTTSETSVKSTMNVTRTSDANIIDASNSEDDCLVVDCTSTAIINVPLYKYSRYTLNNVIHADANIAAKHGKYGAEQSGASRPSGAVSKQSGSVDPCYQLTTTFIPLLFDCWIECYSDEVTMPLHEQSERMSASMPALSRGTTMLTICRIIKLVTALIGQNHTSSENNVAQWFKENYFKDFCQYFMKYFPYDVDAHASGASKSKGKDNNIGSTLVELNIILAEIMCFFMTEDGNSGSHDHIRLTHWSNKIIKLVNDILLSDAQYIARHLDSTIGIVLTLLKMDDSICEQLDEIVNKFYLLYQRTHWMSTTKAKLLSFLESLVEHTKLHPQTRVSIMLQRIIESWLEVLPKDLPKIGSENATFRGICLRIISTILIKKSASKKFMQSLQCVLSLLFENTTSTFYKLPEKFQRKIVELLYWLPEISAAFSRQLAAVCQSDFVGLKIKQYLVHVLFYCCLETSTSREKSLETSTILSLFLSVIIGYSTTELKDSQGSCAEQIRWLRCTIVTSLHNSKLLQENEKVAGEIDNKSDTAEVLKEHESLVKTCLDCLQNLNCHSRLGIIFANSIKAFLNDFKLLPQKSVLGIILLSQRLLKWGCVNLQETFFLSEEFTSFVVSAILTCCCRKYFASQLDRILVMNCAYLVADLSRQEMILKNILQKMQDLLQEHNNDSNYVDSLSAILLDLMKNEKLHEMLKKCSSRLSPLVTLLLETERVKQQPILVADIQYTRQVLQLL